MQKTLPNGWKWVKIGEVCETITGGTPLKGKNEYFKNGTIPWLRSSELTQGAIYKSELFITELGLKNSSAKILPQNSVLVAMYGATAGQVGILRFESAINQAICGILPNKTFMPEFLYWFLSAKTKELKLLCAGGAQQNLSQTIIKNLKVILPPLPTQHKIVEILKDADNLRKLRQQADEKMKDLIPSLFVQMFGDPAKNPKGWPVKKLGELCHKPEYGLTASAIEKKSDFQFLRITDIQNGMVDWEIVPFCDSSNVEIEKYKLHAGDIVIARIGATTGKAFLFTQNCPDAVFASYLIRARPKGELVPKYLYHYMNTNYYWVQINADKSSRLKQGINIPTLSSLSVPLSPLPLQQEFAKLVEDIEAWKARQAESRKKLDELFNSLMYRAFAGELVA